MNCNNLSFTFVIVCLFKHLLGDILTTKRFMKILKLINHYASSIDYLLVFFLVINLYLIGHSIITGVDKDLKIPVREVHSVALPAQHMNLSDRQITGMLSYKADGFFDYIFVDRKNDEPLSALLASAIVLFLLIRIKYLWSFQRFSLKLYRTIDFLSVFGVIIYVFSRIQDRFLANLVLRVSEGKLQVEDNSFLLSLSATVILFAGLLKNFAKQGNKIEEEQNLTI